MNNIEAVRKKIRQSNVYFRIKYSVQGLWRNLTPLRIENRGIKEFNKQLQDLSLITHDNIIVDFHSHNGEKIIARPDISIAIGVLNENSAKPLESDYGFNGFGSLGSLGTVENYVTNLVTAQTAQRTLQQLESELEKTKKDIETKDFRINELQNELIAIKDKLRENEFVAKIAKIEGDSEVEKIKRNANSLQSYLPVLGTVIAQIAKINPNEVRGLLGLPGIEEAAMHENRENSQPEINAEQKFEFKPESQTLEQRKIREIHNLLTELDKNNQTSIISDIYDIFLYISQSIDNLKTVKDLIK